MSGIEEKSRQSEQVTAIVRREGHMPKPSDTQCRALIDGNRCENLISFNEDGDYWSVFCKEHSATDEEARTSGEARMVRADRESEVEEEVDADNS